ncbi:hypothetical protein ACK35S_15375, partial [Aeromonas veronii]
TVMDAMKLSVSKEFIISTQPIGCITSFCMRRNLMGGSPKSKLRIEHVGFQPEREPRVPTKRELVHLLG